MAQKPIKVQSGMPPMQAASLDVQTVTSNGVRGLGAAMFAIFD
jgi:hypothetical protein